MQFIRLNSRLRAGAILLVLAALVLSTRIPAAMAQDVTPKWQKLCEELPDTNCITAIQDLTAPRTSVGFQILEPKRDAPSKILRILIQFPEAPASQSGTIKIALDGKPFAEMPFAQCPQANFCFGQKPLSDGEIVVLERTKAIQVRSEAVTFNLPAGELAAVRASRGMTFAEFKEVQDRVIEELKKSAERLNKKSRNPGFLDEAPATKPLEGFCTALQEVITAAPGEFKSIIGRLNYSFYAARVSVPGSGTCEVPIETKLGYSCTTHFRTRVLAEKQMAALVQNVGKCLPHIKPERSAESNSVTVTFDHRRRGEEQKTAPVSVWFNYSKFEGSDDYSVSLNVDAF